MLPKNCTFEMFLFHILYGGYGTPFRPYCHFNEPEIKNCLEKNGFYILIYSRNNAEKISRFIEKCCLLIILQLKKVMKILST